MKKTKLLLALCFTGCMANAQIITTVAGNGTAGYTGDGGQATAAELNNPDGIAIDAAGNLYIAEAYNNRIRKINTAGVISTIAGNGTAGFSGDGGQAAAAEIKRPYGLTFDASGNLYFADNLNNRIRKINTSGIIITVAGNGTAGFNGDGGQATAAEMQAPSGIALDASGNIYFGDSYNNRIRKINTSGIITTIAGNGTASYSGDGGQATAAELYNPTDIIMDATGNLFISDNGNNRVRKVTTAGIISTVAGNGTAGYSGDGGQASSAELSGPGGIAFATGNLFISDILNNRIRMINSSGLISTIAGNGTYGFSGDGGQATFAELAYPWQIAFNSTANIMYIVDAYNNRIRKVTACPANAGPNVSDYDSDGSVCAAVAIGTASVSGMSYTWSPTTALSCTNCAQPNCSYDNLTTPKIYTLTVSGSACITATSTVQVTTLTPTITANVSNAVCFNGENFTAVGNYTANYTPTYYYWSINQVNSDGSPYTGPGAYNWDNGWGPLESTGYTFTYPNTSTLTCGTYYVMWFSVGNSCSSIWTSSSILQNTLPANAGGSIINQQTCSTWSVQIGTPSVSGMSYSWSPATKLSSTTIAQPVCTWTNISTPEDYTLTVSKSGCTSITSTLQVTAELVCNGCCTGRMASGIATNNQTASAFVVYPNPSSGQVTISLYDKADYIQLIDMQGRLIYETKDTDAGDFKLDISKYNSGIYFIRAKIGDVIERQKLMVE